MATLLFCSVAGATSGGPNPAARAANIKMFAANTLTLPRGYAAYTAFQRVTPWLDIHLANSVTALGKPPMKYVLMDCDKFSRHY